MTEAIVARDVRKSYGETTALAGVSLSVAGGEVFALVGPNGAGKTTLVRALTGTTDLDAGAAELLGTDPTAVRRHRVGLLPQAFDPPERLTARELVTYYAGLYDDHRDPDAVLADVGLADAADTRYEHLSGGQRRRTCVGTALANDPDVLFLDEPTTGIDPAGQRDVWGLVQDLADEGATVFLTTHDMDEAERLADRVGLLADGDLVAVGSPADLVAEHGGRPRLSVETDATPAALADSTFDVADHEGRLVFRGLEPVDIGDAIAALSAAGVDYGSLTWTEPDLEDVYLRLAGGSPGYFAGHAGPTAGTVTEDGPARPATEGGDRA
jgi:ABC-2 type transport system ATP-binding protein